MFYRNKDANKQQQIHECLLSLLGLVFTTEKSILNLERKQMAAIKDVNDKLAELKVSVDALIAKPDKIPQEVQDGIDAAAAAVDALKVDVDAAVTPPVV